MDKPHKGGPQHASSNHANNAHVVGIDDRPSDPHVRDEQPLESGDLIKDHPRMGMQGRGDLALPPGLMQGGYHDVV
jgi:hypothetical protein